MTNTAAFASPTISDSPYEAVTSDRPSEQETAAAADAAKVGAKPEESTGAAVSQEPGKTGSSQTANSSAPSGSESTRTINTVTGSGTGSSFASGTSSASSGSSGTDVTVSDIPSTAEYNEVGLDYSTAPKVGVELGFTVVSPEHEYSGFKVAEGSVQLSDGSWDIIGYGKLIRGGYYRLLREVTDTSGVQWYVVAANASRIGGYTTPDGSRITELWLKKSDCSAKSVIEINTSNTTRQNIVRTALSLIGNRYSYGGSTPDGFDCSGFVSYVMKQNGISVPRTSSEQCRTGKQVGLEGLRPGDIVGRTGHVGIYIGNGYFVHASENSTGVIVESVAVYNKSSAFTNYVSVVGD